MKPFVYLLFCLIATLFAAPRACADLIWVKGKEQPTVGQVLSQTEKQIQFRFINDGHYGTTQTILVSQIESLLINIDQDRLEKLSPLQPEDYSNYAEELSTQTKDLAAIELAKRLYFLAAVNSRDQQRYSALLGLASLATENEEKRKFEMLLRLNSSGENRLPSSNLSASVEKSFTQAEKQLMLSLVLALRQEQALQASKILKSAENREKLKRWSDHCTLKELERIATKPAPTKVQLHKLLQLELLIRQTRTETSSTRQDWADLATKPSGSLAVLPTLANATRFDPANSIYRNGEWISP